MVAHRHEALACIARERQCLDKSIAAIGFMAPVKARLSPPKDLCRKPLPASFKNLCRDKKAAQLRSKSREASSSIMSSRWSI